MIQFFHSLGQRLNIPNNVDVHIIAGQSNATGAETGYPTDSSLNSVKGYIIGQNSNANGYSINTFTRISIPYNNLSTSFPNVAHGIELKLGQMYYQDNNKACCIVKVTQGDTSLEVDWASGSFLRNNLITFINSANTQLAGRTINWKGFYWNQGEADAGDNTYATNYQSNLESLAIDIKANTPISDATKWVTVRSHIDGSSGAFLSTVRTAQENAAIPNSDWINCDDTDLTQPADIHVDSDGQNVMAIRYYSEVYP